MGPRMKKLLLAFFAAALLGISSNAWASLYIFQPSVADIYDLDHYYYYSWGINWTPKTNEQIISAQVYIKNINNWTVEDDSLYVNLLDTAPTGLTSYWDNQGGGNNFDSWVGAHILVDTYHDAADYPGPAENYSYFFDASELALLNQYAQNGNFGLGFDPDCHYWNDGVKFKITTRINVVPEPGTLSLLASGLIGSLGVFRKKRS